MKIKMILKKGMVFLFAAAMAVTGVFSLGVMAASGLEGAYISPKSKMGLKYANNFSRDVSKSQIDVPNFMADSDSNGDEPNKSFNAQQVAAGNSDAGQKWHGFAAYAKNHDSSDFWVMNQNHYHLIQICSGMITIPHILVMPLVFLIRKRELSCSPGLSG